MIENHVYRRVGPDVQARIDALEVGQKMQDLPVELWHESFRRYVLETPNRGGGPNMRLIRLDPRLPSLTVTGFVFNKFVHPEENRYITVREAARLQGFPDSVAFQGTLGSTQLQVGNAVPPALACAVLTSVADSLGADASSPLTALSLFAGAGGFDVGARNSGVVETLLATDAWSDATATLATAVDGCPTKVLTADIHSIERPLAFWSRNTGERRPDVIFGGPPCQSFSQAGKQRAEEDARGSLIFQYLRLVDALRPKAFVLENVSNIRGVAGGRLIDKMLGVCDSIGYQCDWRILNAADFGVPQRRRRFFLVGIRKTVRCSIGWPSPTHAPEPDLLASQPYVGVGAAFQGLPTPVDSSGQRLKAG